LLLGVGWASLVVAGIWGSAAILAFGATLVAGLLAARIGVGRAARRWRPTRHVGPVEVHEDRPVRVRIDLGGGAVGRFVHADALGPDGRWHRLGGDDVLSWRIGHRGAFVLEPTPVRLRDAYGLVSRIVHVGDPVSIVVLPEVPDAVATDGRFGGEEDEPDELRPLVPGTPLSRVHWRTSARRGELIEQRFAAVPAAMPVVALDTTAADDASIDVAVREVAGLLARHLDRGGSRLVLPGAPARVVADRTGLADALRRLAVVGSVDHAPAVVGPVVRVQAARPGRPAPARAPLPWGVRPA